MKAVILAGGKGTRISDGNSTIPKPLVEIGGKPIIWHIMKMYSHYGINDFVICLGHKGNLIRDYFLHYKSNSLDLTLDVMADSVMFHSSEIEPWRITFANTGEETMTGGRLKRIGHYLHGTFCMTYGDGVSDVDIRKVIDFHHGHKKLATVTAAIPPGRFGAMKVEAGVVTSFHEKQDQDGKVNGGFFVLDKKVLDYIDGDHTVFEHGPLEELALQKELMAYQHDGFWQPMDTLKDKETLEELWYKGAPWRKW